MRRITHMCMSVRGVLRREKSYLRKALTWLLKDDGQPFASVADLREALLDELAKGHEVIPMTREPCEGFDYSGGGCRGHDVPASEVT